MKIVKQCEPTTEAKTHVSSNIQILASLAVGTIFRRTHDSAGHSSSVYMRIHDSAILNLLTGYTHKIASCTDNKCIITPLPSAYLVTGE